MKKFILLSASTVAILLTLMLPSEAYCNIRPQRSYCQQCNISYYGQHNHSRCSHGHFRDQCNRCNGYQANRVVSWNFFSFGRGRGRSSCNLRGRRNYNYRY